MASQAMSAGEAMIFILMLIGYCLQVASLFSPYWEVEESAGRINDFLQAHKGLWMKCNTLATGSWDCDDYNRAILGLPAFLQVGRAVGIVACIIGFFCLISLLVGCQCNNLNYSAKRKARIIGGILGFISGVAYLVATGPYAARIVQRYEQKRMEKLRDRTSDPQMFGFGWSLYVGWASGALMFIMGIAAIIFGACKKDEEGHYSDSAYPYPTTSHPQAHRNYAYKPEQPAVMYNKEYV